MLLKWSQFYSPVDFTSHFGKLQRRYLPDLSDTVFGQGEREREVRYDYGVVIETYLQAEADLGTLYQFGVDIAEDFLAHLDTREAWLGKEAAAEGKSPAFNDLPGLLPHGVVNFRRWYDPSLDLDLARQYWGLQRFLLACRNAQEVRPAGPEALLRAHYRRNNYYGGRRPPMAMAMLSLHQRGALSDDDLRLMALADADILSVAYDDSDNVELEAQFNRERARRVLDPLKEVLLEVEFGRGDLPTDASAYVRQLGRLEGAERLARAVELLGKDNLSVGWGWSGDNSRSEAFSHVIAQSYPADEDTPEAFASLVHASGKKLTAAQRRRWVEVAMYATQWAEWIGAALGIEDLASGVWWFHAHATDYATAAKETVVARYSDTPLSELGKGGVDVDWYHAAYAKIGKADWKLLQDAAKRIGGGTGHRLVKLYSAVMLGEVKLSETLSRIEGKRDKDYVRCMGLLPLSKRKPDEDLLRRYEVLQAFAKTSRQYGQQRQASEREAVEVGIANLARTAGYPDVVQFEWRMEGAAVRAMLDDNVAEVDGVTVTLSVDEEGQPEIAVRRGEKSLKNVPAKLRKHADVARLTERKKSLREQLRRTRASLERAMVAGTVFAKADLERMAEHPIVARLLDKLLLIDTATEAIGFYRDGGLHGVSPDSSTAQPLNSDYRLAHPTDLYRTVTWDLYQRYAFDDELRQPFKQIFRELYLLTDEERELGTESRRYQGHQVQPAKTVALLRTRGWTANYDEGLQRVDRQRGLIATVFSEANWFTPADIEAPTLEHVVIYDAKTYRPKKLAEVDPIFFSEVMRDLDLVVSVAHVGGVDPEASHSTVEMRAALVRESARLFKLDNVEVKERHVLIAGELGKYAVHLGSGMVSKGGLQLPIFAVRSQQRGRMFLPFVDDDPTSAEVVSKVLTLARDGEVRDPTVLGWLG